MIASAADRASGPRWTLADLAAWWLAAFVFTIPIEEIVTIPVIGSPARLVGLLAIGFGVVALFGDGRVRVRRPTAFVAVAAVFVGWNLLSVFWSRYPDATVGTVVTFVQLLAFAWLVAEFAHERSKLLLLMQGYVLGNLVAFAITGFNVLVVGGEFRDTGPFNANQFAIILSLGVPMAAMLVGERRPGLLHVVNLAYPVIATFGVVLGASRSGLIVCLIALAVIPFSLVRLSWLRQALLVAAVTTAVWFSFLFAPQLFPELYRNIERLQETSDELTTGTLTGRTVIWRETLVVFWTSPIVGVGSGAARLALVETALGRSVAVHNAYLSVAASTGLVGLLLFLGMIVLSVVAAVLAKPRDRPFTVILAVALLVAMTPANSEARKDTWFALALLAAQRPIVLTLGSRSAFVAPPSRPPR